MPPQWPRQPSAADVFELQQDAAALRTAFSAARLHASTCARLVAGMEDDIRWAQLGAGAGSTVTLSS